MSADKRGNESDFMGRTPGAHLRAEIERLGLDQVAVSKAAGVSRQSVNNIINGRQPISRAMAAKLGRLTGRSSDYWLGATFSARGKIRHAADAAPSGVLADHQIVRAVKDGVIGIVPFDASRVRPAAIMLTLERGLTLSPGETMATRSRERIELPLDFLGRVGIVGRLAVAGAIAAHAYQLEPGFKGPIDFQLFNAGGGPLRLRAGDAVLGLEITRLGTTPQAKNTT